MVNKYKVVAVLMLFMMCNVLTGNDDIDIEKIKHKYTWGSIYLTESTLFSLERALAQFIGSESTRNDVQHYYSLKKFYDFLIEREYNLIQINLIDKKIGYIEKNEKSTEIDIYNLFTKQDVEQMAYWVYHFRVHAAAARDWADNIRSGRLTAEEAWRKFKGLIKSEYLAQNTKVNLAGDFRKAVDSFDQKTINGQLLNEINEFKEQYDFSKTIAERSILENWKILSEMNKKSIIPENHIRDAEFIFSISLASKQTQLNDIKNTHPNVFKSIEALKVKYDGMLKQFNFNVLTEDKLHKGKMNLKDKSKGEIDKYLELEKTFNKLEKTGKVKIQGTKYE